MYRSPSYPTREPPPTNRPTTQQQPDNQGQEGRESWSLSLGVIMNDWKAPIGGGGGGATRSYTGPNGSAEKVDYSQLPLGGGGSDDEGGGDDWIQRQIRGHKVS